MDGLRALSILLVICGHASWYFPAWVAGSLLFRSAIGNGRNGVAVFFVISGYLITSLLRREFEKTGTVSLKHFYFRRSMRIFPPFYFFLAIMAVLWALGWVKQDGATFLAAATYTLALVPRHTGYFIEHSWSLSIEEIFYLFWPFAFLVWHRRQRAVHVAVALILLLPVLRVALHFLAPTLRGHENYMIQGWIDTMMVGCMLALLKGRDRWDRWRLRYLNPWTAGAMVLLGFVLMPAALLVLPKELSSFLSLAVKPTVLAFCIGGILIYLIESPGGWAGRILNQAVVRHIGIVSYSLYLWQQLFTSDKIPVLPLGFLFAFAAAEFSFWLVEKPSLRLRAKLESQLL